MKVFLLVFDRNNCGGGYSDFLTTVDSEAKKHEEIECLSRSVYMIPSDKLLPFVSAIGVLVMAGFQKNEVYKYKCLMIEDDAQWLHFDGYQLS